MLPNEVTGYVDIRIHMEGDPANALVMLEAPDGGVTKSKSVLPVSEDEVRRALASAASTNQSVAQRSGPSNMLDPMRGVGQRLYAALFEGRGQVMFERVRAEAERRGQGVRLVIGCDSPPLEAMPWEFLHDGRDFLSLSVRSAIVRLPHRAARQPTPPLTTVRMLLAVGLDIVLDDEARLIQEALKPFRQLELTVLSHATPQRLHDELAQQRCDFFCYLGLGRKVVSSQNMFTLSDDYHRETDLPAEQLGEMLAAAPPRLVFLGANASDDVARTAARSCPSVIGLSGPMSSVAIAVFARSLFSGVMRGQPLEAAVAQARQEVDIQNPGTREWGLPVVYTSAPPEPLVALPQRSPTGSEKGERDHPPTPAKKPLSPDRQARQRKLSALLTIRQKNLQALKEQQAASPAPAVPYLDEQIHQTEADIAGLEQELDEVSGG